MSGLSKLEIAMRTTTEDIQGLKDDNKLLKAEVLRLSKLSATHALEAGRAGKEADHNMKLAVHWKNKYEELADPPNVSEWSIKKT